MASDNQFDRLVNEQRVLGPGRVIRDGEPVTPELAERVIAAVQAHRERTGATLAWLGRAIGVGQMLIGEVLRGMNVKNRDQILIDLDKVLEDEAKRETSPRPTEFVWTKVAEEIAAIADAAISLKTIGLVYGDSGIGKTLALRAVAADKPGSIMVSIETVASSGPALIDSLGKKLRIAEAGRRSSRHTLDRIKRLLSGTSRLLIFDEVHKLCVNDGGASNDKALHVLRDLHDATGCPMLWCGTTDMVAYLERRQTGGREPLGQIRRRIGICRNLVERTSGHDGGPGEPLFSVDEIRRVMARSKLRLTNDAARYLMMLANIPGSGGLGACSNLVVMATKLYETRAAELTADMLRDVHRLLVNGPATYAQLESQMQAYNPRPLAAKAG